MYAATPPPTSNTDDQRPNQLRCIDAQHRAAVEMAHVRVRVFSF
jgi:hypothetical protein